ncbi:large ribosomal subunit protein mL62 [Ptiloglossa arizonensis]|uniref:large ribosomal subunit protein mL62 n=1 Tax=Ptiloglossa arizonensis TaxID=3350558 RepID=UPI003F9FF907
MNIVTRQYLRIFKHNLTLYNQCNVLGRALAFKSALSLDKLYPTSNLQLFTPTFVPEDPNAKFSGYIPIEQLNITYCRSSGAGGQHVNCTNSKVDLRFHLKSAKWLSEEIKEKLLNLHITKINKEGYFVIKSELTRSQHLNLADALRKLRTIIWDSIKPPPETSPETKEMKRKQLLAAARKRLHEKRMHSETKQNRRPSITDLLS